LKLVKLNGESSFARGLALGKKIKDICVHNLLFLQQELAEKGLSLESGLKLASENEKVIASYFPELLEEIRGVAEGAQLPYNSILLETAFPFIADSPSKCTIISALGNFTTDRLPIVGRNYDFLLDFKKCNQIRIVKAKKGKFSFVGGTITMLGVEEGLNNAGLFIGDAGWEPKELSSARGLSSRQVMQLVLENCSIVDVAVDFILKAPKFANNAGTCYLLVDKKEAVVMEMGLTKSCLRESDEGVLVAANVFLTPIAEEMKPPEPTAFPRYEFVKKYFHKKKGRVDSQSMQDILSDHRIPICAHNEINTLRSMIAKTHERRILMADGNPCASKFEGVKIPK